MSIEHGNDELELETEGMEAEVQNEEMGDPELVSEEETEALEPLEFKFKRSEYSKVVKIQSRSYVKEAVQKINELLGPGEKRWFHEHPQFRHFFHMHLEKKNKFMGMWMLLLHTTCTSKKMEAWFVLNGVPIRYSLIEHGLISGLYCHNYPLEWEKKGSLEFVNRHFEAGTTISYEAVKEKFFAMKEYHRDRLQMAILYFLSSVIIGKNKKADKKTLKGAPSVEPFFLRAVGSLALCETFPWGRLSFDHNLSQMNNLFDHFNGVVKQTDDKEKGWCYTSFNLPLQLLAFESVRVFQEKYREPFVRHDGYRVRTVCPRMCYSKFTQHAMTGFPLSELYETLGTSTDIQSIMLPTPEESILCENIFDGEEDIRDEDDYIVDGWMKRLTKDKSPIFLQMSFDLDVNGPKHNPPVPDNVEGVAPDNVEGVAPVRVDVVAEMRKALFDVQEGMAKMGKDIEERFERVMNQIGGQGSRINALEAEVGSLRAMVAGDKERINALEAEVGSLQAINSGDKEMEVGVGKKRKDPSSAREKELGDGNDVVNGNDVVKKRKYPNNTERRASPRLMNKSQH